MLRIKSCQYEILAFISHTFISTFFSFPSKGLSYIFMVSMQTGSSSIKKKISRKNCHDPSKSLLEKQHKMESTKKYLSKEQNKNIEKARNQVFRKNRDNRTRTFSSVKWVKSGFTSYISFCLMVPCKWT